MGGVVNSSAVGSLSGRVAVVTGAGRGLGQAHALALAEAGASVMVNDVHASAAFSTMTAIEAAGGRAAVDGSKLGTVAAGAALIERAHRALGTVGIVVNNAGISAGVGVEQLDDAMLDAHLGVHLRATVGTTRAAFALMREQGWGRVVNTISGHGLKPVNPGSSAYAAAKASVFGFTRAAALEVPPGVTVNAVAPLAYTRMSEAYLSGFDGAEERFDPAHVAAVVVWLCSEAARGVNGRIVRVHGRRVGEFRVETSPWLDGPTDLLA